MSRAESRARAAPRRAASAVPRPRHGSFPRRAEASVKDSRQRAARRRDRRERPGTGPSTSYARAFEGIGGRAPRAKPVLETVPWRAIGPTDPLPRLSTKSPFWADLRGPAPSVARAIDSHRWRRRYEERHHKEDGRPGRRGHRRRQTHPRPAGSHSIPRPHLPSRCRCGGESRTRTYGVDARRVIRVQVRRPRGSSATRLG